MHQTSLDNMIKALSRINLSPSGKVLDVGGRGLNGKKRSYRAIISELGEYDYHVADIQDGEGVTHVMPSEYQLPFPDSHFHLVVSGQTLEHVRNPFRLVTEMKRVLKPGCHLIIIAPSAGRMHDNPDCWRFMRDAFKAIAHECRLTTVADWITDADQWRDHTWVAYREQL